MKYKMVHMTILSCAAVLLLGGCAGRQDIAATGGAVTSKEELVFFSPIARGNEKVQSNILSGFEESMKEFETENPGIQVQYKTYTQMDYKDKSYDDIVLERVRGQVGDDVCIMNPDVAYALAGEGFLYDMSDLDAARAMTDAARNQCTIKGEVVSLPMTMITYGLYVNVDLLDQYGLAIPDTKEEFLHCCEVLKENGVTPLAGNRWWLENFVLTQGFAPLYLEQDTQEKIAALNSGETPMSRYMRPGIEFLAEMMDKGYFDVGFAATAEAGDEGDLFLDGKVAFVIHHDGAISEAVYGTHTFDMEVIGFPTDEYGQVNLMNASDRISIDRETEHLEAAVLFAEKMCSRDTVTALVKESGGFPPRTDVKEKRVEELERIYANVDAGRVIPGSNPEIALEQWGTACRLIQDLLAGDSVDAVLDSFDQLQMEGIE